MQNQKYKLDQNKIEIIEGEFSGLLIELSDFQMIDDKLSYNYQIISGEVAIDKGNEFKSLIISVVDDIISNYTKNNKGNLIE